MLGRLLIVICPLSLVSFLHAEDLTVGLQFQAWLDLSRGDRPALEEQAFAAVPLTKREASVANRLFWDDHMEARRAEREAEMEAKEIVLDEGRLRFESRTFGVKPANGWSLYISMHGGGNAPPKVNDRQWQNQIGLYKPSEGIYVAPRAPTDTWNLWHRSHIDALFDRLIENFIMLREVDPNRV